MPIGDLNKLIDIIGTTRTGDGMGSFTESDVTIASNVWCAIWPISAKELIQSMQNVMEITHRIRIRYRSTFRPDWRIKFGNRYFAILSVINPNERGEWLDLMVKEAV
jgi:SPP1 family predicted phage head-tail adaptor